MGKNLVREEFLNDGTWTCPAGVTKVRATVFTRLQQNQVANDGASFGVTQAGALYAWGINNTAFPLGVGDVIPRSSPVIVTGGLTWQSICTQGLAHIGLANTGDLYGWGINTDGQLGVGDTAVRSSPVLVLGGLKFRTICGTGLAIRSNGAAYAWGYNGSGECGIGNTTPQSSPILVLGGLKWRMAVAGLESNAAEGSSLGIDSTGAMYAWGSNRYGQLGTGDVASRSSPVAVLGGLKWKWVSSSGGSSYGISVAGDLYAWGNNSNGQLGLGDVISRSSPVLVSGGLKWRQVSAAASGVLNYSAYGLTTLGVAYAWGINTNGQLGTGDVTPRSSPVLVAGGLTFRSLAVASNSALGITTGGDAYAWGLNSSGQLGLGTVVPRSSPVLVLGGLVWRAVDTALGAELVINTIPLTAYPVTIFSAFVQLGGTSVYTDTANAGAMPVSLVLEYEA